MATVAEILEAAKRAEAAGDMPAAKVLRDRATEMQAATPSPEVIKQAADRAKAAGDMAAYEVLMSRLPSAPQDAPQAEGPQVPPRAESPQETRQRGIDEFALFEMANPVLKGRYTLETMPKTGDMVPGAGGGGRSGPGMYQVQPWSGPQDTFGETAQDMMAGPVAAMGAFGGGLTGGPSPSREYLAGDPLTQGLPGPVLTALGGLGDAGGAALSTVGAGLSGLIGLGVEAVPGQNSAQESKLGSDLLGMSMFAVPELSGVSSVAARAASGASRAAPKAADAVPSPSVVANVVPTPPAVSVPIDVIQYTPEQIGDLTRKAASGGMGSVKAQEKLAEAARINPEAKAAADRLGIELPVDVFSDSENLRATVGLTRSEVGKEPEALWRSAVKSARDKADEIMAAMDGSPDIASVSEAVKSSLSATQSALKDGAKNLYEAVDAVVPKASPARVENIVKALNGVIQEIGGVAGMTPAEKALYALVTGDQAITYGRLLREKNLIGKAIARGDSPYSSMDSATLNRMYGAISEDQMATVASLGDDALRQKLREANRLTAKQKALEKRIVASFGSDLDGSIGAKLKNAVKQGAQGDIAGLQRILKVIPDDLKKQAMASAISAATRSARATEPGFGPSEFSKFWAGVTQNKPVLNAIGSTLGGEAMGMLKDLQTVAQRIAIADSNVLRTGKANQALVGALTADGVVGRVLHSTAGQRLSQAAAIGAGTFAGGPIGGMVAGPIAAALTAGRPDMLVKAGKLFASDEFQKMAIEAAQGAASAATIDAVKKSSAFREWAAAAKVRDIETVLRGAGLKAAPTAAAQDAANTSTAPEYEALWGRY